MLAVSWEERNLMKLIKVSELACLSLYDLQNGAEGRATSIPHRLRYTLSDRSYRPLALRGKRGG